MEKGRLVSQTAFPSYGSHTLAGDFRTSAPGAYFPAVSWSVTAANRGSRDWIPTPTRWFPISVRCPHWAAITRTAQDRGVGCPRW